MTDIKEYDLIPSVRMTTKAVAKLINERNKLLNQVKAIDSEIIELYNGELYKANQELDRLTTELEYCQQQLLELD